MADLAIQPVLNYGQLLSSYGEGLATQENATTNNLNAQAAVSQLPYQRAQIAANVQNVQAQTTGQDLANQQKQLQMGYYAHLLQNMNAPAANFQGNQPTQAAQDAQADPTATSTAASSNHPYVNSDGAAAGDDDMTLDDANLDPAHIKNGAQTQFAVKNVWTPGEYQNLQLALASGVPGAAEAVQKAHDARLQSQVADAQFAASRAYNSAYTIATSPHPFASLEKISPHPEIPQAIAKLAKDKNWDDEEQDEFTAMYSREVANAVHPFSGRDIEVGKDGIARDKQTQQPLLGAAPEGMSASDFATAYRDSTKLVDVPNSDGSVSKLPQWKAAGATSATQYIHAQENGRTLPLASSNTPRPVLGPNAAPVQGAAPGPQQAPQGGAPRQTQQQPQLSAPADPVLKQALADPDYKLQTPQVRAGVSQTPAALEQAKATVAARNDLVNESQNAITTASQSITYLDAAKAVLDSKGVLPKSGPIAGLIQQAARVVGGDYATNYQEIAKYLGNAALQNGKANFGKNFTQKEVDLQLNQLSPSNHMTDGAVANLIDSSKRNMQYAIGSAQRSRQYLAAGGDPQQFADWNQKYWDRSKTVNQSDGGAGAPAVGTVRGGYRFKGGDPSNKSNWSKQ